MYKMPVDEDIFDKEINEVVQPKKPKRKLTEKQLENLRIGREKMKLKRELAKKNKELAAQGKPIIQDTTGPTKAEVKASDKAAKENQKNKSNNLKKKRKTLKELNAEKEALLLAKLEKEEQARNEKKTTRLDLFSSLKVKCLEKAKSVKEYKEIQSALEGIDEDTLLDDEKLKAYARTIMKPYINLPTVKEEVKEL
jgi:hypothetical protein